MYTMYVLHSKGMLEAKAHMLRTHTHTHTHTHHTVGAVAEQAEQEPRGVQRQHVVGNVHVARSADDEQRHRHHRSSSGASARLCGDAAREEREAEGAAALRPVASL